MSSTILWCIVYHIGKIYVISCQEREEMHLKKKDSIDGGMRFNN